MSALGALLVAVPSVSEIRRNLNRERSLLGFYAATVAVMLLLYQNASTLQEAAARIPKMVITGTLLIVVIHVLVLASGMRVSGFQDKDADEEFADEDVNMSDVNLPSLIKEMVWICVYVAGLFYIGFFVTTFVFVFGYIFVKEQDTQDIWQFIVPVYWAAGITGLLYLLIVIVLENFGILRLGMFP